MAVEMYINDIWKAQYNELQNEFNIGFININEKFIHWAIDSEERTRQISELMEYKKKRIIEIINNLNNYS